MYYIFIIIIEFVTPEVEAWNILNNDKKVNDAKLLHVTLTNLGM